MRNIILNPTKRRVQQINKRIQQYYRPRQKQALIVFTTNIGNHPIYKVSLDTFPALGTGITTTMVSEIPVQEIEKKQYIFLLYELYRHWENLPFICRGYTPRQVRWFRQKFGSRVFSEYTTVNWWRNIR
ncbi:MAG: hypothetical protein HDT49_08160 [Lactobacillus sp.]|uniref:hypothetical protein n=1 Tax=Limosilactobacillus agrestis TaxID=2759748 RepID=UPI0019BF8F62|nr:hypothetical protein [Limosilactobacillus agrestis]MBD5091634.1 hypothetical protein [Lactobacillus sp.]MCD7113004.1 hypothetical protein [Limosilactobacillus agrestis]